MATSEATSSTVTKRKADEMESTDGDINLAQPPRNAKVIELLPEADVTLQVGEGEDALDIKVSGVVLRLASKVFKAMLRPEWAEASSKIINLEEDNPQVILDFCYIIHHQHSSIRDIDAKRLRGLITLADMRDCHDAIAPWLSSTLSEYTRWILHETVNFDSYCDMSMLFPVEIPGLLIEDLIAYAYHFDHELLFRYSTDLYLVLGGSHRVQIRSEDGLLDRDMPVLQSHGVSLFGRVHLHITILPILTTNRQPS